MVLVNHERIPEENADCFIFFDTEKHILTTVSKCSVTLQPHTNQLCQHIVEFAQIMG